MQTDTVTIPARSGKAARVWRGQSVTVTNTHGSQVVDTWAFNAEDLGEWMSMEHSRPYYMKLRPEVGDTLVTNRRRPILTLVEDTSGGAHDTLIAACDQPRYALLGVTEYHDNCADNLTAGLAELGITKPVTPSPLNLQRLGSILTQTRTRQFWHSTKCQPASSLSPTKRAASARPRPPSTSPPPSASPGNGSSSSTWTRRRT